MITRRMNRLILTNLLDLLTLSLLFFIWTATAMFVKPYHRGYFIDDITLRLPYKHDTVPYKWMIAVYFAITTVAIIMTETIRDKRSKMYKFAGLAIPKWAWLSYVTIGVFIFGLLCQQVVVEIAKMTFGRLRPHFFDLCKPTPKKAPEAHEYITDYTCVQSKGYIMRNMRMSFPSGHTSFSVYVAVFLSFYIQKRFKWKGSKLLKHGFQIALISTAWYVSLSRVSDHKHHWEDVAVGMLIGGACGYFAYQWILRTRVSISKVIRQERPLGDHASMP